MGSFGRTTLRTGFAVAVALGGLVGGGAMMQSAATAQEAEGFDRAQLRRVAEIISNRYVEEIPTDQLYRRAIDGMLEQLGDPNTRFIDAADATDLEITTTGNYAGLGIRVQMVGDWVTVMAVISGTPAEREGLLAGDRIIAVDGTSVAGWDEVRVIERLRGPAGEPVTLRVARFGALQPIEVTVTRADIHVAPVLAYLASDDIGVVRLSLFSRAARGEIQQAIDSVRAAGASRVVLDLRGNPGGLLEEGVAVSDLFLAQGKTIVSTVSRLPDQNQIFRSENDAEYPDLPMVVLQDVSSASASEIVAGALQDHDRALIVGVPSYGKGSMQTVYRVPGGHHLKLTTAAWYTPSGRSIERDDVAAEDVHSELPAIPPGAGAIDVQREAEDGPSSPERHIYYTTGGRVVYGGGGIVPDVTVDDSAGEAETRLGTSLARKGLSLRQLAFQLAVEWLSENPEVDESFVVTADMRARFLARLRDRGVTIEPADAAEVGPLLDRFLAVQIAGSRFGELASLRRSHEDDPVVRRALELLERAESVDDVLKAATPVD